MYDVVRNLKRVSKWEREVSADAEIQLRLVQLALVVSPGACSRAAGGFFLF